MAKIDFEFILMTLIGGPALMAVGMSSLRKRRIMANTPTSKVRSASMGVIELRGLAIPHKQPLLSPVTRTPCCWWECHIETAVRTRRRTSWRTLARVNSPVPFYLEDETGRMLVEPNGAEIYGRNHVTSCNGSEPYLAELGAFKAGNVGPLSSLRAVETCIPSGGPLYVIGELAKRDAVFKERRLRYQEKIRSIKHDRESMSHADIDKDGRISVSEWDTFTQKLEAEFILEEEKRAKDEDQLALRKPGDDSRPMIVSIGDEKSTAARYLTIGLIAIPAGLLGSVAGVFTMNRHFDVQTTAIAWLLATPIGLLVSDWFTKLKVGRRWF